MKGFNMSDKKQAVATTQKSAHDTEGQKYLLSALENFGEKELSETSREKIKKGLTPSMSDLLQSPHSEDSYLSSPAFGNMALQQLNSLIGERIESVDDIKNKDIWKIFLEKRLQISYLLKALNPRDQIEGMLVLQMIGIHYATMETLSKAYNFKSPDIKSAFFNSSSKLSRTYAMLMEALNRHRGKGQQKMTVEHVHVNAGGQAIIGNVQSGNKKKQAGGGSDGGKTK